MIILIKKTKKLVCVFVSLAILICTAGVAASAESDKGYIVITDTVAANTGADVSAQIQAVIDANPNRTIYFPDGEYIVAKPILTPAEPTKSVSLELSDFAVIKAGSDFEKGQAIIQLGGKDPANNTAVNGSNYSLEGGIIDGSGVANGVSINSGRETAVRNVSVKNTVVGLHVMYGANSGSSDADIYGVNIIGTGDTDSVGILLEGFDNTLTNIRIGHVFTGVHIKSAGNMLRNIHPLYYSDYTDYENSCGFLIETGNNWFDYCYSDQFAIGFRTTDNGVCTFENSFCYWYSEAGDTQTAFRADGKFNSKIASLSIGFKKQAENVVLSVGQIGGTGTIENLDAELDSVDSYVHLAYVEDSIFILRVFGFFALLFEQLFR